MINIESTAAKFKALGDPTRLQIFEFLRGCCCPVAVDEAGGVSPVEGPTVGEICCQITGIERATSTISFHLKELRNAGLVTMVRRGKHKIYSVDPSATVALAEYFSDRAGKGGECCG